jgi:uncharacterized protein (UPF0548 family)
VPDPLTYAEVGRTLSGPLPAGYQHVRRSAVVGRGAADFDAAAELLMTWQVQRRSGLAVLESPRVALGEVVWMGVAVGPLKVGFRCRVVGVVDEPRRKGFAYGTLPGHPESGEEAFVLAWREDDLVELEVIAFSRPAQWWSRIAGPAGRVVQRWITGRYLKALVH